MTSEKGEADDGLRIPAATPAAIEFLTTAYSRDGVPVLLTSGGTTGRCWSVEDGPDGSPRLPRQSGFGGPKSLALAVEPGADIVIGRGGFGELWRWDRCTGQALGEPARHSSLRTHGFARYPLVTVVADGRSLAFTDATEGGLRCWDARTGVEVGEPIGEAAGAVWALASTTSSVGSAFIVSGGADGLVHRWDPITGAEYGDPIEGCGKAVEIVATRLNGARDVLVVVNTVGELYRLDLLTGAPLGPPIKTGWQPSAIGRGPRRRILPWRGLLAAVPAGDVTYVAACSDWRTIRIWDLTTGVEVDTITFPTRSVTGLTAAELPDNTPLVVVGRSSGDVIRFDARDRSPLGEIVYPHGWSAGWVLPVAVPDGRSVLVAVGTDSVLTFDARTGSAISDRQAPWQPTVNGLTAIPVPGGRTILIAAGEDGIGRQDLLSGTEYPQSEDEKPFTIWDVASATLPDGRAVVFGAGHDGRVYRWDAATGRAIGEPLEGHPISVKAVASARQEDGSPMFITGCEAGHILRWDAATGARIGEPLPGAIEQVGDLEVVTLPGGSQILVCLDLHSLHRWDAVTGQPIGTPITLAKWPHLVAVHVDAEGTPTAFVRLWEKVPVDHVEQWRLDTGTRVAADLPASLRAIFDDDGVTWAVLGEGDGSLAVQPLDRLRSAGGAAP